MTCCSMQRKVRAELIIFYIEFGVECRLSLTLLILLFHIILGQWKLLSDL